MAESKGTFQTVGISFFKNPMADTDIVYIYIYMLYIQLYSIYTILIIYRYICNFDITLNLAMVYNEISHDTLVYNPYCIVSLAWLSHRGSRSS